MCDEYRKQPEVKNYTWDELISYCKDIHQQLLANNYNPNIIIAISRGGFFTGLMMSHLCQTQYLYSIKASTNIDDSVRSERVSPQVESLFTSNNIDILLGKKILLVDDVFNTGFTLKVVYDYLMSLCPDLTIKTACMIYDTFLDPSLPTADIIVDFYSDKRCAWAIFPWETIL